MGNCCLNYSQGCFAHEGLAVQCCKGETPVAVWIFHSPPTSSLSSLSALRHCFFLPYIYGVAACFIKVSSIIRCRIKNHLLAWCFRVELEGVDAGAGTGDATCASRSAIFQSRSPSPNFETSTVQDKEISPKVRKAEKKADCHSGRGKDKPRPKERIDNIDFQTSAVLHGATNVEVIRPDAATPILDSKLAARINTLGCASPRDICRPSGQLHKQDVR